MMEKFYMNEQLVMSIASCCTLLFSAAVCYGNQLQPFSSDGCSVFFDGNFDDRDLWLDWCLAHDMAYWRGGTYDRRKLADATLKECVEAKGEKVIAEIMEAGVRVGGSPFFPTTYRWGYGWKDFRGYWELTAEETREADRLLNEYREGQKNK